MTCLAVLAAIGVVELFKWGSGAMREARGWKGQKVAAFVGVAALCGVMVRQNLSDYFERSLPSEAIKWTFGQDFIQTCDYLNGLPADAHVYFYSSRWSSDYEPRRFLAPRVRIENRSKEFAKFSLGANRALGTPYFVLVGPYRSHLPELRKKYPQGHVQVGPLSYDGKPAFLALRLMRHQVESHRPPQSHEVPKFQAYEYLGLFLPFQ